MRFLDLSPVVFGAVAFAVLGGGAFGAGCAGESKARRSRTLAAEDGRSPDQRQPRFKPGTWAVGEAEEDTGGVAVAQEIGYLSQGDVEGALERHAKSLIACYQRAGDAQRYAQGKVVLRFLVMATGKVQDVMVVSSELGNYAVERCLVVEGRAIPFPPPEGNQETDFEYALQFRSSGEVHVLNWQRELFMKDLAVQAGSLSACGSVGSEPVQAVAYVQPSGAVASVGLSSRGPLDVMNAMCVVEQIRKWRLPSDNGHMVRTSFPLVATLGGPRPASSTSAASSGRNGKRGTPRRSLR